MNKLTKFALGTVGFIVTTYLTSVLYGFVDLQSSALNPIGREVLARENQVWIFATVMALLHLIFLLSGTILSSYKRVRPLGIGVLVAFFVSSVFSSLTISRLIDDGDRVVFFDDNIWQKSERKPITMARDIYLNWGHCQTREEIIEILGRPSMDQVVLWEYSTMKVDSMKVIYYLTDNDENYLIFNFASVGDSIMVNGWKSKVQDCNSISLDRIGERGNGTQHLFID
jgi:hypothetical protein